jgi:hypothetical protein
MSINFDLPTTADTYTGVPTTIRDNIKALGCWLDPTYAGTVSNADAGAKRLNSSSGLIEQFNGTAWAELTVAYAKKASPTFTGTPAAPTAAADTNTTQLATTAFVLGQKSTTTPLMDGTATVGTGFKFALSNHVHPTDTSRAPLASPAFTGSPTAPTQAAGNNSTRLATTAYVQGELASYAPLAAPIFTGVATGSGLRATGTSVAASGQGLEMMLSSSDGYVTAYDRTAGAYLDLRLRGLTTYLYGNGSIIAEVASTNLKVNKKAYTTKASVAYAAALTIDTNVSNLVVVGNLTGNVTSMTLSNATEGQFISIRFRQDGVGGRTVALPAGAKVDGSVSTGANRTSYLNLTWNATDSRWEGNWSQIPA